MVIKLSNFINLEPEQYTLWNSQNKLTQMFQQPCTPALITKALNVNTEDVLANRIHSRLIKRRRGGVD